MPSELGYRFLATGIYHLPFNSITIQIEKLSVDIGFIMVLLTAWSKAE